jgi:hypothetical protein
VLGGTFVNANVAAVAFLPFEGDVRVDRETDLFESWLRFKTSESFGMVSGMDWPFHCRLVVVLFRRATVLLEWYDRIDSGSGGNSDGEVDCATGCGRGATWDVENNAKFSWKRCGGVGVFSCVCHGATNP